MKYISPSILTAIGLVAIFAATSAAAGTVTGTVFYEGTLPNMRPIDMSADPVCMHHQDGEEPRSEMLVVGEEVDGKHTLGNVFVEIVDGLDAETDYALPEAPVVLTQAGCRYDPRVFGVRAGQPLQILNPDGTLHNVNGLPKINRSFNLAMPRERQTLDIVFEHAEPLFPIRCDVHPWMAAYCAVMDHPYFDTTGPEGRFSIENLPPGQYELRAWHERLGEQFISLEIPEDENELVTLTLTFSRPG